MKLFDKDVKQLFQIYTKNTEQIETTESTKTGQVQGRNGTEIRKSKQTEISVKYNNKVIKNSRKKSTAALSGWNAG